MVESNTEAARPARRRSYRRSDSVQKAATDSLFKGLDRFGLAPVLLLGLAYIGHTQVVVPLATAYANVVAKVGENNEMLRKAIETNDKEDGERVAVIAAAQAILKELAETNRGLNEKILQSLQRIEGQDK